MTINLYQNNSEKNRIGKSLTLIDSLSGTLREECTVEDPSILIESSNPINANYAEIVEFGRKYFITKRTSVRNNLWRLDMHVDVLESHKDAILNCTVDLDRQEYAYNLYLADEMIEANDDTFTLTQLIGGSVSDKENVILTLSNSSGEEYTDDSF